MPVSCYPVVMLVSAPTPRNVSLISIAVTCAGRARVAIAIAPRTETQYRRGLSVIKACLGMLFVGFGISNGLLSSCSRGSSILRASADRYVKGRVIQELTPSQNARIRLREASHRVQLDSRGTEGVAGFSASSDRSLLAIDARRFTCLSGPVDRSYKRAKKLAPTSE